MADASRRSAVTSSASRPARTRFSRTRARRSASSSAAMSSARPGVRCAMCSVLPPGAAQASSTRMPAARVEQRRGELRAAVLHRHRARHRTRAASARRPAVRAPPRRRATRRRARRGRARATSAGNPRRCICAGSTPQHHRRMRVVGRQDSFRAARATPPSARRPASADAHDAAPDRHPTAASNSARSRDEAAQHRVDHAARAAFADDAARVHGEMHLGFGRAARVFDLVRGRHEQRRESRRRARRTAGSTSGASAGARRRYQRNVPSAIARTAARSARSCAASSADIRRATLEDDRVHGERGAARAFPRPGAWRARARPVRLVRARRALHAPNLSAVEPHGIARNRAPTRAACRRAAARARRARPRRRPRAGRRRRCLTRCRARRPTRDVQSATLRAQDLAAVSPANSVSAIGQGLNARTRRSSVDGARQLQSMPRLGLLESSARRSRRPRAAARPRACPRRARRAPRSARPRRAPTSTSCRSPAVSCSADGMAALEQHRAGVEALIELHDGHAGFGIAREDRALDRRGAAPARQQRAVDVHAAEPRQSTSTRGGRMRP